MVYDFDSLAASTVNSRACFQTLSRVGILHTTCECRCGEAMEIVECQSSKYSDLLCWHCQTCNHDESVRQNSFLSGKQLSMKKIIQLLWCYCEELNIEKSRRYCGVHETTAIEYLKIFRKCLGYAMSDWLEQGKLGTHGIVELDESVFKKKPKYHRGRSGEQKWVFGMVERQTGRCVLKVVPNRRRETLLPIINTYIQSNSTIYSDQCGPYFVLTDHGYAHAMVNHTENFIDPNTNLHTNTIEDL